MKELRVGVMYGVLYVFFLIGLPFFAIIWGESCAENHLIYKSAQQEKGTEGQQGVQ